MRCSWTCLLSVMCSASYLISTPIEESKGCKGRTKLERRCMELSESLPEITDRQMEWGRKKMRKEGIFFGRGRGKKREMVFWCQECGHNEVVDIPPLMVSLTKRYRCPGCGRNVNVCQRAVSLHEIQEKSIVFSVVTMCEGLQVVRNFCIRKLNFWSTSTIYHCDEVFQNWFDVEKGKEVILSRPYYRTPYSFRWYFHDPFKVKKHNGHATGNFDMDDVYSLSNMWRYPKAKVCKVLRRNGWKDRMLGMNAGPVDLWRNLLTNPAAEIMAKGGQYDVLDYWLQMGGRLRDTSLWLPSLKICNRHGYIIRDANLWFDHWKMLQQLGMDVRNPKFICPEDIMKEHVVLQEKMDRVEMKRELEKLNSQAKNWEGFYSEEKGRFFGVSFSDGEISVHVIRSVAEMLEEGTRLHHCVYKMGYYKRNESLILSARGREDERLETVEVNLENFTVVQSRGLQNRPSVMHRDIVELVEKNMGVIRRAAKCVNVK